MCRTLGWSRGRAALRDDGFTLIELLIALGIIGILVTLAIPRYLNFSTGSRDSSAASDLRSGIMALEHCYTKNSNSFPAAVVFAGGAGTPSAPACSGDKINYSAGTTLTYTARPSGCTDDTCVSYVLTAKNANGSGATYSYDSASGGTIH